MKKKVSRVFVSLSCVCVSEQFELVEQGTLDRQKIMEIII